MLLFSMAKSRKRHRRKIRAVVIDGEIVRIPLTQGKEAIVDLADLERVREFNWHLDRSGSGRTYCRTTISGVGGNIERVRLHNIILDRRSGFVADHINGDGLDNRRCNLRYATVRDNARNVKSERSKGVHFQKDTGLFRAVLILGEFKSRDEASDAYDRALAQVFPEFGQPNKKRAANP